MIATFKRTVYWYQNKNFARNRTEVMAAFVAHTKLKYLQLSYQVFLKIPRFTSTNSTTKRFCFVRDFRHFLVYLMYNVLLHLLAKIKIIWFRFAFTFYFAFLPLFVGVSKTKFCGKLKHIIAMVKFYNRKFKLIHF